jgi:TDG/mug DNA glycosylase family protein
MRTQAVRIKTSTPKSSRRFFPLHASFLHASNSLIVNVPATLPDIIAPGLKVLFCGINPGLSAAAAGHHFLGRSNRFWRVMHLAGFTPEEIPAQNDRTFLTYGYGLTTVVSRATAGADELTSAEFKDATDAFERKIARYAPRRIAFLGKAAYAGLSGQRDIAWGLQTRPIEGAEVWVLPNPSGRNRGFTLERLVDAYAQLRRQVRD